MLVTVAVGILTIFQHMVSIRPGDDAWTTLEKLEAAEYFVTSDEIRADIMPAGTIAGFIPVPCAGFVVVDKTIRDA